jgi:prolyl oligopeptidase
MSPRRSWIRPPVARVTVFIVALAIATIPSLTAAATPAPPPPTRVEVVRDTLHGVMIEDPYRWLEDQDAPATRAWLDAENAYTRSVLDTLPGADRWRARFEALLGTGDVETPRVRGERLFYVRRAAGDDALGVLCTRLGPTGPEEVLVDPTPLSADGSVSVSDQGASVDGDLLAYGLRSGGQDQVEIHFMKVATHETLADVLPRGRYMGVEIVPDHRACYYTRFEPEGPRVRRHRFGDDPSADPVVFGEGYGSGVLIQPLLSEDGRWLALRVLHGSAAKRVEVYLDNLADGGPIVTVVNDTDAAFEPQWGGGRLYMRTDWKAPNWRIVAVDREHPDRAHWTEIVPERADVLQALSLAGGRLFATYLANALPEVRMFGPEGRALGRLETPTIGSFGQIRGAWGTDEAFYTFESFGLPKTVYRYVPSSGKREVWHRPNVPVNSDDFELKQVWYRSKDGTRIPMLLFAKRGLAHDGSNPTLLTGYGGFDISMTPRFSALALVWAEHGGVYARPNLRGGGEFGEKWHEAGMLGHKQNVFDDFIGAAEWLIHEGYTNRDRLAIAGGSNGGLLVGAAETERPDLFKAVVCSYPLLDMLRYDRFLVARFWVPEYGSASDSTEFGWLRAYSPYQNVREGVRYPATLLISGDSDTRVAPLHARKMTALLQAVNGGDPPVLLSYDTHRGHTRGTGVSVAGTIEELTEEMVFLGWQVGLKPGTFEMMDSPLPVLRR